MTITIKCPCGEYIESNEEKIMCPRCRTVYIRYYNPLADTYEWEVLKKKATHDR